MYRCENCKEAVPPNTKMNRVVVETREKTYAIPRRPSKDRRDREAPPEFAGTASGFETVREVVVCASCAVSLAKKSEAA